MRTSFTRILIVALAIAALCPAISQAQTYFPNWYWTSANYIAILGRNPDAAGWMFWDGLLNNGSLSQTQLTQYFLTSGEYCGFFGQGSGCTNPPDDSQFLTLLYQNAWSIPPDGNYSYWLGQLAAGVSRAQVVYDFINTTQFVELYSQFCLNYFPGYATALTYSTAASAVSGPTVATPLTVTYASPSGTADIESGQIQIDGPNGCAFEWDTSGTITQSDDAGNCHLNPGSSITIGMPGNTKSIGVTLQLTFSSNFVGSHEVYAWGLDAEDVESFEQDLGPLVVSEGPDFTISATPSAANVSSSGVIVTVTVTSVNGFGGSVNFLIGFTEITGTCNFGQPSGGSTYVPAGGYAVRYYTFSSSGCTASNPPAQSQFTFVAQTPQTQGSPQLTRGTPPITLTAVPSTDFSVTVSNPSSPTLSGNSSNNSITYPVTVTALSGFSGTVNFSTSQVSGLPCNNNSNPPYCVTASSFSPTQVTVGGSSGNIGNTTLTLTASGNVPGGQWTNVTITGTTTGGSRSATFALSTQVTTFTGNATPAANNGTQVSSTLAVPSPNPPQFAMCAASGPGGATSTNVSCNASGSQSVSLNLTANRGSGSAPQALHGTYMLGLNGGAGALHAMIVDEIPSVGGYVGSVQAGGTATFSASGNGLDPGGDDGPGEALLDVYDPNQNPVGWGYIDGISEYSVQFTVTPPSNAAVGYYQAYVDLCGGSVYGPDEEDYEDACLAGPVEFQVTAPPPPPCPFPTTEKSSASKWLNTTDANGNQQSGGVFTANLLDVSGQPPNGKYQGRTVNEVLSNGTDTCYFEGSTFASLAGILPPVGQLQSWTISSINTYGSDYISDGTNWELYYQGVISSGSHVYPPPNTCANNIVQTMWMNACAAGGTSMPYDQHNTTLTVGASNITATRGNASVDKN